MAESVSQPPPLPPSDVVALPAHHAIGADGAVVGDLPCLKCAYNLRGLTLSHRCPECGTAVGYSAQGDLLRFSDPNWVDKLRYGVNLMIAAVFVAIIVGIAFFVSGVLRGSGGAVLWLGVLVVNGLSLVGAWLFTTPDPSGLGERDYGTARKIIRITLAIDLAVTVVDAIPQLIEVDESGALALQIVEVLGVTSGYIGLLCTLRYCQKLAMRIPQEQIARRAYSTLWGLGIAYGLMILIDLLGSLAAPVGGMTAVILIAVSVCLLWFFISYLFLLGRMGRSFREQAALARRSWATAAA